MTEEWRDIKGYEGLYQVSNLGNVFYMKRCRVVKEWINNTCGGYCYVRLHDGCGRFKNYRVHRLVAEAFIPNPNNLPEVNHKDEDKTNNKVDNLEWCCHKYNIYYGNCRDKISKSLKGRKLSEQHRQHIREHSTKSFLGKHHTLETKLCLSKSNMGANNGRARKLIVFNDNESYEFDTIKDGAKTMNVPERNLYYYFDRPIMYKGYYWKRG